MTVLLIVAAAVSVAVGDYQNAAAILGIVVLNAVLGFYQEFRAEKANAALKKLAVPHVKVRRDGHVLENSDRNLVVGDIHAPEAGKHCGGGRTPHRRGESPPEGSRVDRRVSA